MFCDLDPHPNGTIDAMGPAAVALEWGKFAKLGHSTCIIYIYVDVYSTLKYEFRNTTCQNLPNMERPQSKTVSFAMSGEFFGDLLSLRMIWLNHKNSTD